MAAVADRHKKSNGQGQGMNWIRPVKRLAIYLRDGLACCYCGEGIEAGAKLTLDHLTPHSHGGTNHGITAEGILGHIEITVQRPLDVPAAKTLIERRGGFVAACQQGI